MRSRSSSAAAVSRPRSTVTASPIDAGGSSSRMAAATACSSLGVEPAASKSWSSVAFIARAQATSSRSGILASKGRWRFAIGLKSPRSEGRSEASGDGGGRCEMRCAESRPRRSRVTPFSSADLATMEPLRESSRGRSIRVDCPSRRVSNRCNETLSSRRSSGRSRGGSPTSSRRRKMIEEDAPAVPVASSRPGRLRAIMDPRRTAMPSMPGRKRPVAAASVLPRSGSVLPANSISKVSRRINSS